MVKSGLESFFTGFGKLMSVFVIGMLLILLIGFLREVFSRTIFNYKWKHRFDKPPKAKCYCQDCRFHGGQYPNSCKLPGISRCTPPEGFCYEAEPREYPGLGGKS